MRKVERRFAESSRDRRHQTGSGSWIGRGRESHSHGTTHRGEPSFKKQKEHIGFEDDRPHHEQPHHEQPHHEQPPAPYIEPNSSADYFFNRREIVTGRSATRVILAVGQVFKKILEYGAQKTLEGKGAEAYNGFIYFRMPIQQHEIVRTLEDFVPRFSRMQFTSSAPEETNLPPLSDTVLAVWDLNDYMKDWSTVPDMGVSDVKKYCADLLPKGESVWLRIDVAESIRNPVVKRIVQVPFVEHPLYKKK
jgi:hypothetical protein